ncbi:AzlD domain-containing protein [Paracoccus sp. (in: a-proteobacteria)]|uniref:AzlD domain-containing protein n=1 Tax=Paracoccus sp. TaxID=267 RepID=UPI003A858A7E
MNLYLSNATIWTIIVILGIGTFLLRWSFLGTLGQRDLPPWILRMLRYTPVSVLPALVAPLVIWPAATQGAPEPARLSAAAATILIGIATRSVLLAILGGAATLYGVLYTLG